MPDTRLDDLRRRVDADPTSIAFAALAEEYRRVGRFQDAADVCRKGLERHPSYLSARVTLGRALLELNDLDAAQQELEHVLGLAPENLAAIRGLAEIHRRRGDAPETAESYRAAIVLPHAAGSAEGPTAVAAAPPAGPAVARLETLLAAIVAERRRREASPA
jgi:tetratricopeptide (TPR) repeat protein